MSQANFYIDDFEITSEMQKDCNIEISPISEDQFEFKIKEDINEIGIIIFYMPKKRAIAFAKCLIALAESTD